MNTLFLRLEGPLQSWGVRARWTERDTALEPTKSGVVGLLACTLGWGRDRDAEIRELSHAVTFGVRVDCPGHVLRDYQTVSGGAMAAEGKVKLTATTRQPETIVSPRAYLADASFLAAIQASESWIDQLARAVTDPVWPPCLGRKSCPPSLPLFEATGDFNDVEHALEKWPRSPRTHDGPLRAAIEVAPGTGIPRRDQIDILSRRRYLPRYSTDIFVDPPTKTKE